MSDFNTTISFDVFSVSLSFVDEGTFVVVKQYVDEQLTTKQDKLIAGENITIVGNVISSTGGTVEHDDTLNKNGNPNFLHITQAEKDDFVTASDFVEDFISNATNILYADLLALIDNNELIPNSSYRITNYTTTTVQADTISAGHNFDIIVTALSTNELSEIASCVRKAGDTYFTNANLKAWDIKYCIDNDTTRFAWADTVNGKGVIYYMKDEWNNECPYDFKNIQFKRYPIISMPNGSTDLVFDVNNQKMKYALKDSGGTIYPNGAVIDENNPSYYFTFNAYNDDTDLSDDGTILNGVYQIDDADVICRANIIKTYFQINQYSSQIRKQELNNVVLLNLYSLVNSSYFECQSNIFGNNCFSNTFGNYCYYNTFGNNCYSNTFGNYCNSNTFGNECQYNTFGNNCYSNTFGNYCGSNTFGDYCQSNTFGDYCQSNTFGDYCQSNTFGNDCSDNTFGNSCGSNTFGNDCSDNTFGNNCFSNTFGNKCSSNKFYVGTSGTTKKDYISFIVLEDWCSYNNFYSTLTTSGTSYLQRIRIKGLEHTTPTNTQITLSEVNTKYEWVICYTSGGVLKQYCIEDRLTNNYSYKIEDTIVSSWVASTKYVDFAFQAQINITDLSEADFVNVVFGVNEAVSGNYASAIEQYAGYILVFSKVNTAIIIPTISVTKIDL